MKIKRFRGRSICGYLDFDISFLDQLTFVTGINGSGKTSVLNSIAALLLPRLDYLASQEFDQITLDLTDDEGKTRRLSATKTANSTEISCSAVRGEVLRIPEMAEVDSVAPQQPREYEERYFTDILNRNRGNPVLDFIESLPTPMYLGLDRRSVPTGPDSFRYVTGPLRRPRTRRNIFGRSLETGLTEALRFARQQFQVERRRELALDERFRQTLFLELIDLPLFSLARNLAAPTNTERQKIEDARKSLEQLPEIINLDKKIVHERLDPVFQFLNDKFQSIKTSAKDSDDRAIALFEWSYNKSNVDKISRLSEIISEHTRAVAEVKQRSTEYLRTINEFMRDSGKTMSFNNIGELVFKVGAEEDKSIGSFSSGEMQLVVILTHLYFNPEVARANVFIIDEPELSLHVEWQEKFVDGIVNAATETTQFILATHSPAIILDKTEHCVDLSRP